MTLAFLALLGAPYIYEISSLRVKARLEMYIAFERLFRICLAIMCLYYQLHPFGIYLFVMENKHKTVNKVQLII